MTNNLNMKRCPTQFNASVNFIRIRMNVEPQTGTTSRYRNLTVS